MAELIADAEEDLIVSVIAALDEGLQILDESFRYLYLNDAAISQAQLPAGSLLGRKIVDCYPGVEATDLFRRMGTVIRSGAREAFENRFEYPDGSVAVFELVLQRQVHRGKTVLVILSRDVTQRVRTREELVRRTSLEACARQAGTVAHDLNNLLMVVENFAELAADDPSISRQVEDDLRQIRSAAVRGSELAAAIMANARVAVPEPQTIELCGLLRRVAARRFGLSAGQPLRLVESSLASARYVAAYVEELEAASALMMSAVSDHTARTSHLSAAVAVVRLSETLHNSGTFDLSAGSYVVTVIWSDDVTLHPDCLAVLADLDQGIKAPALSVGSFEAASGDIAAQSRQFAAGPHLTLVDVIAKRAGGGLLTRVEGDGRVRVELWLPMAPTPISGPHRQAAQPAARDAMASHQLTVAVVDNDAAVLESMARGLLAAGFHVTAFGSSREARDTLRGAHSVDLLVTDVLLPDVSGEEVAAAYRTLRPNAPVLYVTAHLASELPSCPAIDAHTALAQKPIGIDALVRECRSLLAIPLDAAG